MADLRSPLSPSSANGATLRPSDQTRSFESPKKHIFGDSDQENEAPNSPRMRESRDTADKSPQKQKSPTKTFSPIKTRQSPRVSLLTEEALRENEDYSKSITDQICKEDDAYSTMTESAPGYAGMDDTCFSAFSAVPNTDMTKFANLMTSSSNTHDRSPTRKFRDDNTLSRPSSRNTPSRSRWQDSDDECSPTPRRRKPTCDNGNDTTNLLVDFTDQFAVSPYRPRRSPAKNETHLPDRNLFTSQPNLSAYSSWGRTPSPNKFPLPAGSPNAPRHLANLLDFDLPPAPTPRSIPSISARELESMKSQFLSQISSLSASLSGKEAEVKSLKDAVNDAERRAGEAQEQIRDQNGAIESLKEEKADLERRQTEMQSVLQSVKEEIIRGDREKDALLQRVQEADYRREEAEAKTIEAESKLEAFKASASNTTSSEDGPKSSMDETPNTRNSKEVEVAVTKVAKELHGLYKSKHEAKVTALKKSYSDRWEKKVRELTTKVDDLTKENEDLRVGRDATMSGVVPGAQLPNTPNLTSETASAEDAKKEAELQIHCLEDKLHTLESELTDIRTTLKTTESTNSSLYAQLEASRVETADLIAASEELMSLFSAQQQQQQSSQSQSQLQSQAGHTSASPFPPSSSSSKYSTNTNRRPSSTETQPPALTSTNSYNTSSSEGIQRSLSSSSSSRSLSGQSIPSGLKAPRFGVGGESRIGRMGGLSVSNNRPGIGGTVGGSGSGSGSGILGNIERMGRG